VCEASEHSVLNTMICKIKFVQGQDALPILCHLVAGEVSRMEGRSHAMLLGAPMRSVSGH